MQPATRYLVISGVLIVSLTSTAALVAIWSALSRRNRLLRAAVFFALPAAFLYAQAAEPAIGLFVEMLTICGVLLFVRWFHPGPSAAGEPARRKLQFHFRDVLFAIAMIAVVMAGVLQAQKRLLVDQTDFASFLRNYGLELLQWFGLGIVSVAAAWLALGTKRGWLRLAVLVASVAAVYPPKRGLSAALASEPLGYTFGMFLVMPMEGIYEWSPLVVLGALAAIVFAYLRLWRCTTGTASDANTPNALNSRSCSHAGRRIALGVLSFLVAAPAAYLYYELARPIAVPQDEAPSPNGWDLLVKAGSDVEYPPGVTRGMEMPVELPAVVQQNQKVYADARQALALPSRVRVSYTKFSVEHTESFRDLARAFDALGKFHTHNGDWDEALRTYQDVLRLADRTENGGMVIDMLVADPIAGIAMARLEDLVPKLTAAQSRVLMRDVLEFERKREPLADIVARDEIVEHLAYGWMGRWNGCIEEIARNSNDNALIMIRRRADAEARALRCDLAIHAYWLDHGRLPREPGELVPGYLAEIPLDPWDGAPIKLVFRDGEYLVYSVGPNRRDDGGQPERDTGDWPVTQRTLAEEKTKDSTP